MAVAPSTAATASGTISARTNRTAVVEELASAEPRLPYEYDGCSPLTLVAFQNVVFCSPV